MLTRMQQRRGLASEWSDSVISSTVILAAGEVGLETDTGRFKLGNGTTVWANLPYYLPDNNPTNSEARIGKNSHDIYSKLSPLGPGYSQTFTGGNVMIPQSGSQTPLVVAGLVGQTALLQSWRSNISNTTPVASISSAGKLTAFGAEFNAAVDMNTNKIVDLGTPTSDADAATKLYVDQAIAGLSWKAPVNLVSASDLDIYINVPLTGNTETLVLDGHAALDSTDSGYRILLFAQTTASQNGIYVYNDNGTTYTLTRAVDADTYAELNGASVFVNEGTHYGTSSWVQTNHYLSSFEDQEWIQFNGASQIVADGGLTKTGNTLAVGGTTDRIQINSNSVDISANYVGQTSITTLGTVTTGTWTADTIAADQGGTGQSSYTVGDILYASSTSALSKLPAGTLNYPLISGGTATDPLYGQIVTDAIADSSSTTTGVTYSKIQYVSAANKILGRISSGSGHIEELNANNVISIVNGGTSEFSISRIPTGTTNSTVALGDHTHTIDQLSDVIITGTPAVRQVIKYNGSSWVNELPSGGISTGPTPPDSPSNGDAWFDTTDGSLYVRYDDGVAGLSIDQSETVSVTGVGTNGYTTSLQLTITYDAPNTRYLVSYIYTLNSGSTFFTNGLLAGSLVINGTTVWTPSGQYSISANSSITLASEGLYVPAPSGQALTISSSASVATTNISSPFNVTTITSSTSTPMIVSGSSAQWVQVKANSALEASILTRMSAVEARDTKLEAANAVRVANQAERDSVYPAPVQGNTVFRADLGYEEKYYAAYNATTNPDGTTGTIGWYRYAGGAPLSENKIINGGMDIWQRGTASPANTSISGYYNVDRFVIGIGNSGGSITKETSDLPSSSFGAALKYVCGSSYAYPLMYQTVEELNAKSLAGKTVTLSAYVKTSYSTSFDMTLSHSTTGDIAWNAWSSWTDTTKVSNVVAPNTWTRIFQTYTVPANARSLKIAVVNHTESIVSGEILFYTGVQLEEGPVATPFRRNQANVQAELAACQRYYWRTGYGDLTGASFATPLAQANNYSGTQIECIVQFPVQMRKYPALDISSVANQFRFYRNSGSDDFTSFTLGATSSLFAELYNTTEISGTAGQAGFVMFNVAGSYVGFSAEL